MSVSQIGFILIILSSFTALSLFVQVRFSLKTWFSTLFNWSWNEWSFNHNWIKKRFFASFSIIYFVTGAVFYLNIIRVEYIAVIHIIIILTSIILERNVAQKAQFCGIPQKETRWLSEWVFFNSNKSHYFIRKIEEKEINWVPSTLTFFFIPSLLLTVSIIAFILGDIYYNYQTIFMYMGIFILSFLPLYTFIQYTILDLIKYITAYNQNRHNFK